MRCYRAFRVWRLSVQILFLSFFGLSAIYIWKIAFNIDETELFRVGLSDGRNVVVANRPEFWQNLANFVRGRVNIGQGQNSNVFKRFIPHDAKNRSSDLEPCPDESPFLVGLHQRMLGDMKPERLQELAQDFEMEEGGRMKPIHCQPLQRIALIIPYSDDQRKLRILLHGLIHVLYNQQADVAIFVIQQLKPSQFNMGALFNVGFLEARKRGDFDCFIFHAHNLVPANDKSLYECGDTPKHFPVSIMHADFKTPRLLPDRYFGGVMAFTEDQYLTVNGHSNLYFNKGGDGQDMYIRLQRKGFRPDDGADWLSEYHLIGNSKDVTENKMARGLIRTAGERQNLDGLSSIKYKVKKVETQLLYTRIEVFLDMPELKADSGFSQDDIESLAREAKK